MLSELTQTAIAVLCDISAGGESCRTAQFDIRPETFRTLLDKLEQNELIRLKDSRRSRAQASDALSSYELTKPRKDISLLDVLEATGEHLNCNHPTRESLYNQYRMAASRLGIINHMTRLYLSEIRLTDF